MMAHMSEISRIESAEIPRRILVAGVVVRDGRVLVMKNIKSGDVRIEVSGGKWEEGETQEEGVAREMLEELGVVVKVLRRMGVYQTDVTKEGIFDVHMHVCEIFDGEPRVCEPAKCGGVLWLTPDELETLPDITVSLRAAVPDIRKLL
jgi:8-oxo-dGTP diphosphatase